MCKGQLENGLSVRCHDKAGTLVPPTLKCKVQGGWLSVGGPVLHRASASVSCLHLLCRDPQAKCKRPSPPAPRPPPQHPSLPFVFFLFIFPVIRYKCSIIDIPESPASLRGLPETKLCRVPLFQCETLADRDACDAFGVCRLVPVQQNTKHHPHRDAQGGCRDS